MSNKVVVKLYDKTETFKRTLSGKNLSSYPTYTELKDYGYSNLTFTYSVPFDNTDIEHYDVIKIISATTGSTLYRGVVVGLDRIVAQDKEQIVVRCQGIQLLARKCLFESASSYSFTKNQDPSQTIKDIFTVVNAQYSFTPFSRTDETIIEYGKDLSIAFDHDDCVSSLKKVMDLVDYNFRIDGDGVVYFRPTQRGRCYVFDGTNDYIDAGTSHGLDSRDAQTMLFRVYRESTQRSTLQSYNGRTTVDIQTDGRIFVETQGTGSRRTYSVGTLAENERADVVVRINNELTSGVARSDNDVDIFINGVKQTKTGTGTGTNTDTFTQLYVGAYNTTPSNPADMKLAEYKLYTGALTDAQCLAVTENTYRDTLPTIWYTCDEGSGTTAIDHSGNGYDGTLTNITEATFHGEHTYFINRHSLTFGKHVERLEINEESDELFNDYVLEYTGGATVTSSDTDSQTTYGTLMAYKSDSSLNNSGTAQERADREVAFYKNPLEKVLVVVNELYDLESFETGQLVELENISYSITGRMITKIDYGVDRVTLYLGDYNSFEKLLRSVL